MVNYWKEQYERVQAECDDLQSRNTKLERSNHRLAANGNVDPDISDVRAPTSPKRKTRTSSPARTSRRSPERSHEQSLADTQDAIDCDLDFLDALGKGSYCLVITASNANATFKEGAHLAGLLFTIHKLSRATASDADTLCSNLVKTSGALGKVLNVVNQNYEHLSRQGSRTSGAASLDQDKSSFSIALSVCAKAFMSILIGTDKLRDRSVDDKLASLIVCELVAMFKSGLSSIETSARNTAAITISQVTQSSKKHAKSTQGSTKESVPARSTAHLLIGFLGLLDKTDPIHQKLFDGFVFILLERVGKRLYYCTFGRHRSTTIEGDIVPMPEPRDEKGVALRDEEALAIRLEVKALVLILERAMGLAPNHMNPQSSRTNKNPNRAARTLSIKNLPTASRARLSPIAKDRLQRTLVTCMYGYDTQDEFLDILTKPLPAMRLGSLQNVAKIDDAQVEEWYKQEVWRLVGWDILAKESGW